MCGSSSAAQIWKLGYCNFGLRLTCWLWDKLFWLVVLVCRTLVMHVREQTRCTPQLLNVIESAGNHSLCCVLSILSWEGQFMWKDQSFVGPGVWWSDQSNRLQLQKWRSETSGSSGSVLLSMAGWFLHCYIYFSSVPTVSLLFGIRACCDLVASIEHECVGAMLVELSCHRQAQMRFQ